MEGQSEPDDEIGIEFVKSAVKLTKFYAEQIEALYSSIGNGEGLASHLVKIIERSSRKGWIKAGDVARAIPVKNRPNAGVVREWFPELASMNKGYTQGVGRSLEFKSIPESKIDKIDKIDTIVDNPSIPETPIPQGIQPENRQIDKIDHFSNFSINPSQPTYQSILQKDFSYHADGEKESILHPSSICLQTTPNPCCEGDIKIDNQSTFFVYYRQPIQKPSNPRQSTIDLAGFKTLRVRAVYRRDHRLRNLPVR